MSRPLGSPFHFQVSSALEVPSPQVPTSGSPSGSPTFVPLQVRTGGPSYPWLPSSKRASPCCLPQAPPPAFSRADPLTTWPTPTSLTSRATPRFSRFFLAMLFARIPQSLLDAPIGGITHARTVVRLLYWPQRGERWGLVVAVWWRGGASVERPCL